MAIGMPRDEVRAYKLHSESGDLFLIYNAAYFDNPQGHEPDKWYFVRYPLPRIFRCGQAFDSAEEAEGAALASDT